MKTSLLSFILLFTLIRAENSTQHYHEACHFRNLSHPIEPTRLNFDIQQLIKDTNIKFHQQSVNFSSISREILSHHPDVLGVLLVKGHEQTLAIRVNGRLKIFPKRTTETEIFWTHTTHNGWGVPFKDCYFFKNVWFYVFNFITKENHVTFYVRTHLNHCDESLKDIFNKTHLCDETQLCVDSDTSNERPGKYQCICKPGYFDPGANLSWKGFSGDDIEANRIDTLRCHPCPSACTECTPNGICIVRQDVYLKTIVWCIQLSCMGITLILALIVFKQRKTKAIASGMWTILETILLGIFILYITVVVKIFEASVLQCLLEPWTREVGFIICYGAIILKLYRHLTEFRTRKAHRWVVKDTDLLKYLLIMIISVATYMAAYTSISLNFMQENFSLLYVGRTLDGEQFQACKYLWWDYVTQMGEITILIFGIHLAYASRNARTQFHERNFLCASISLELAISTLFYVARIAILPELHPDIILIIYCVRTQLSQTITLILIFFPKFWYQQKQVRSLGQEYSCRLPLDAFKDPNTHRSLTSNNSDVEIGEITIADMSPDDIRAELKRLYLQLEIFKAKTICRDNPHISKRRGGRKAQHRRFSLQSLHAKHKEKEQKKKEVDAEVTDADPTRTPEESICSTEGPSAIYADLPSTTFTGSEGK